MAINITSKLLEDKIKTFFGIKVMFVGKLVDEFLKIKKPIKYTFFNLEKEKNKRDFLLTFEENLLIALINKR